MMRWFEDKLGTVRYIDLRRNDLEKIPLTLKAMFKARKLQYVTLAQCKNVTNALLSELHKHGVQFISLRQCATEACDFALSVFGDTRCAFIGDSSWVEHENATYRETHYRFRHFEADAMQCYFESLDSDSEE